LSKNYGAFDDTGRLELIAEAEREAEHLHQFSANLVHIARLEAGALDLRRMPVTLEDLIDATLVRARNALGPRHVAVDISTKLLPLEVDPVLIDQALFHILENAGKYTSADTTVTITAESGLDSVILRVADNGPGFPARDSQRLFHKFYRANEPSGVTGSGLGLAICRGFIEAHGGTITATNRTNGTGTIFTITLPIYAIPRLSRRL
jgi:two-component system, OmpR family, sensor histidine kinase KdpD